MKCIYEHDEEDDFIEIHLSEKDLEALDKNAMLELVYPTMLHCRRHTNFLIRRHDANQEKQQPKAKAGKKNE